MQEIKINQGSNLISTFMAPFSLALREEKGKAEDELISVLSRFCSQKRNQAGTFNTMHKKEQ